MEGLPARTAARIGAWGRGAVAVVVLAGYLGALSTTPAGRGLTLLPHVATSHAGGHLSAPRLLAPTPRASEVLPTLRPSAAQGHDHPHGHTHHHGAEPHTHADPSHGVAEAHRPGALDLRPAWIEIEAPEDGLHRHGDTVHSHDAPTPEPEPSVVLSLDSHRVPDPAAVPVPPVHPAARLGAPTEVVEVVGLSVEIPPPIGRG